MKFYTLDDLYRFCKENNMQKFSAKESGAPLSVHMLETFEVAAEVDSDGLLPVKLQACHTGVNRNKSFISGETMESCADSFKGRPILGAIYQTDTGEYEFHSHDMIETTDADGNDVVEYIEQPIGAISDSKSPYLEHDDANDKDYLVVEGNIFEDYTKAAEILQRRQTSPCSVEILINDMSWNVEDDVLVINDFSFRGVTILGYEKDGVTPIQEGMQGSNIKVQTNSAKKGGGMKMSVFEQLLEQYGVKAEDLEFEYAELSDDELTEKFKAQFEESAAAADDAASADDDSVAVEDAPEQDTDTGTDAGDEAFSRAFSIEISHEDTRSALYNLLAPIEAENDDYFYIRNVYDSYFVAESWMNNKLYKWGYSVEDAVVSLNGEPEEVFEIIVNAAEKAALELMRSEYAELKAFKQQYDDAQIAAEKNEVFEEYAFLDGNEDFEALKKDAAKYSVDEIKTQVKVIHSDAICAGQTFEFAAGARHNHSKSVGILNKKSVDMPSEYKPYGTIFDED